MPESKEDTYEVTHFQSDTVRLKVRNAFGAFTTIRLSKERAKELSEELVDFLK